MLECSASHSASTVTVLSLSFGELQDKLTDLITAGMVDDPQNGRNPPAQEAFCHKYREMIATSPHAVQ